MIAGQMHTAFHEDVSREGVRQRPTFSVGMDGHEPADLVVPEHE